MTTIEYELKVIDHNSDCPFCKQLWIWNYFFPFISSIVQKCKPWTKQTSFKMIDNI